MTPTDKQLAEALERADHLCQYDDTGKAAILCWQPGPNVDEQTKTGIALGVLAAKVRELEALVAADKASPAIKLKLIEQVVSALQAQAAALRASGGRFKSAQSLGLSSAVQQLKQALGGDTT